MFKIPSATAFFPMRGTGSDPGTSLQLEKAKAAVRQNDYEGLLRELRHGLDPELIETHTADASTETEKLLLDARKAKQLTSAVASDSAIDRALKNYDMPLLGHILEHELPAHLRIDFSHWMNASEESKRKLVMARWHHATESHRSDLLKAMLVVDYPDLTADQVVEILRNEKCEEDRHGLNGELHHPLRNNAAAKHPELRNYLKQFPYYSEKLERKNHINLNCDVQFKDNESEDIECPHLALTWLKQKIGSVDGKPDYHILGDAQEIRDNIPYQIKDEYKNLLANAREVHMVANQGWGRFAMQQFQEMAHKMQDGGPMVKRMLVACGTHAMAVEMRIKEDKHQPGKMVYVQNFYDPNLTNAHKRIKSDGMRTIEANTLQELLLSKNQYNDYYGTSGQNNSETTSLCYVVPNDYDGTLPLLTAEEINQRRLSTPIAHLDASVVGLLLQDGFSGSFRDIKELVKQKMEQDPAQAFELLAARNRDGCPRFFDALTNGHIAVVKEFAELVDESPVLNLEQKVELLAAKNTDEYPAFYFSLLNGDIAVKDYVEFVLASKALTPGKKVELLAAQGPDELPGFYRACEEGWIDTAKEFIGQVLNSNALTMQQKIHLVGARDPEGNSSLYTVLRQNRVGMVQAYCQTVLQSQLSDDEKFSLLAMPMEDGRCAVDVALRENNSGDIQAEEAIEAYARAVRTSNLSEDIQRQLW